MSDSPLLGKMDALMKKHRGGDTPASPLSTSASVPAREADVPTAPPAGAWLPVLTDIIERGTPPLATSPATHAAAVPGATPQRPSDGRDPAGEPGSEDRAPTDSDSQPLPADPGSPALVSSELSEQLLNELTPRLSAVMEKQLAAELRRNLDQTVATLLSQLDVNVREIVREAVAEKLKTPRDPSR